MEPEEQQEEVTLLSLPLGPRLLLVAMVQNKMALRLTCHALRSDIDNITTCLAWRGSERLGPDYVGPSELPIGLLSACTGLRTLSMGGGCLSLQPLGSIAGCPTGLTELDVSFTNVADLTPLMHLPGLQTLNCSHTRVSSLAPLAACTRLQMLRCSFLSGGGMAAISLVPLAYCTELHYLDCSSSTSATLVLDLTPLSACTALRKLYCYSTGVSSLVPLSACTALRELHCGTTGIVSLVPLSACTALQVLSCCCTGVENLAPLAACVALQVLRMQHTPVVHLAPLVACTALRKLSCSAELHGRGPKCLKGGDITPFIAAHL